MSAEQDAADHLLAALRASAAESGIVAEDIELLWQLVGELEQRDDPRATAVVSLCDRLDPGETGPAKKNRPTPPSAPAGLPFESPS